MTTLTSYLTGAENGCYVSTQISVKFYRLHRNIAAIGKTGDTKLPTYERSITTFETVNWEKDVDVNIESNLKCDQHIQTKVNKANQIVGPIRPLRLNFLFTIQGSSTTTP